MSYAFEFKVHDEADAYAIFHVGRALSMWHQMGGPHPDDAPPIEDSLARVKALQARVYAERLAA